LNWARSVGGAAGPYSSTVPHVAFASFQAMFAGITVAIIREDSGQQCADHPGRATTSLIQTIE
jgi:hypothetical protein